MQKADVLELLRTEFPDAGIVTTASGTVVHWGLGAQAVFGYMPAEAEGAQLLELVVPTGFAQEHLQRTPETLRHGSATYESVRIVLPQREDRGLATVTEIVVEDSGEGIAPLDQAKLFGAFSRIGSRTAHEIEGTGLGLHLSRKLNILLGGDILVDRTLGQGSRFTRALRGI